MEMTERDKLWYLINGVFNGEYDVETFCSEFTNIYNLDMDYSQLSKQEKQEFEDLCSMAERFSNDENELKIPNMYYSESDILERIKKLMQNLKCCVNHK